MKSFPLLAPLAVLATAGAANAATVVAIGATNPPAIHEDFVFLSFDPAAKREHLVYAARLAPAVEKTTIGIPTIGEPTIEPLAGFDPGAALQALIAPYETRVKGRPPGAPAAWPLRDVTVQGTSGLLRASDVLFDVPWMHGYADRGFSHVAMLALAYPADGRLEISTPAVHLSFESDKLILPRREPSRPSPNPSEDEAPSADKPALPLDVQAIKAEPKDVAPSAEALGKVLRSRSGPLLDCYEALLEKKPGEAPLVHFEAAIRPKGDTASLRSTDPPGDEASSAFTTCVVRELKKKQFPRTNEGWRFTAELAFKPPRIPTRRTHVIALGPSRAMWRSPPRSARLLDDFEVSAADMEKAFGPALKRALGLPEAGRLWVTYWLDRDERRAAAEDALFDLEALPADGEPGTLSFKPEAAKKEEPPKQERPRKARSNGKQKTPLVAALVAAAVVGLALALARERA